MKSICSIAADLFICKTVLFLVYLVILHLFIIFILVNNIFWPEDIVCLLCSACCCAFFVLQHNLVYLLTIKKCSPFVFTTGFLHMITIE